MVVSLEKGISGFRLLTSFRIIDEFSSFERSPGLNSGRSRMLKGSPLLKSLALISLKREPALRYFSVREACLAICLHRDLRRGKICMKSTSRKSSSRFWQAF